MHEHFLKSYFLPIKLVGVNLADVRGSTKQEIVTKLNSFKEGEEFSVDFLRNFDAELSNRGTPVRILNSKKLFQFNRFFHI